MLPESSQVRITVAHPFLNRFGTNTATIRAAGRVLGLVGRVLGTGLRAMRRLILLTIAALLLVRVPVPVHAQSQNLAFDLFREYLESLRVQAGIPGMAAAVVGEDRILWEQAYGRQDLGRAIAARTDTPFHVDGLTQLYTTAMVLRCVEERRLSLDDRVGRFRSDSPEPNATLRQLLTHTYGTPEALTFAYRPERLAPLWIAVRACTEDSYRETLAHLLGQLAMVDSVPGPT